jgi:hypothetical protein
MDTYTGSFWEKARSPAKFLVTLMLIVCFVYALAWTVDDILSNIDIRANSDWWAQRIWHAWWWLITPLGLVTLGRVWHRRTLGGFMWAVGVIWLAILAFGACTGWWLELFIYLATHFGWLVGGALSVAAMIPFAFLIVLVGSLVDGARKRSRLFDRLVTEVCWTPDRTARAN